MSDYVHYIRAIPDDEKPAIYQLASVSVYPSLYEGFGIPIDDSEMAREIERVLSDSDLHRDMIAKGYENIKRFSWDESAKKIHDIITSL